MISEEIADRCNLEVGNNLVSWHSPVEMKWGNDPKREVAQTSSKGEDRVVWSEEHAQQYKNELETDEFRQSIDRAKGLLCFDLDKCIEVFVNALYSAAACMVRKSSVKKKDCEDWFDKECKEKKKEVKRLLQSFQRARTPEYKAKQKDMYVQQRKEYVELRQRKKNEFDDARLQRLKSSVNDSKLFWSTIRKVKKEIDCL